MDAIHNRIPLPLFPAPYPDECLYSIFCRYHQRSGNATERFTIVQLFGGYRTFNSSVLSPYRLYCSDRWYHPDTGISSRKLMMENTAYQYYSLHIWSWKKSAYLSIASGSKEPQASTLSLSHEISSKDCLCFCPECAEEDRRLFGETYWHILPQINGIEYCPVHKCRIIKSRVRRNSIWWHIFPANEAVTEQVPASTAHDSHTIQNYLDLAEDSDWMLHHGASLDYNDVETEMAHDVAKRTHNDNHRNVSLYHSFALQYLHKLIDQNVSSTFLKEMMRCSKVEQPTQLKFLLGSYAVKLLEIRCLYGSVENLYKKLNEDRKVLS